MKRIILIVALLGTSNLFAQTQSDSLLIKQIPAIQQTVEKQKQEIEGLTSKVNSLQSTINQQRNSLNEITSKATRLESKVDSLGNLIETNRSNINTIAADLGTKIQETGEQAETKISKLGGDVEKNRLYWIIATLATLLLGGIIYWLLGKRIANSKTDVETQIKNTKKSLEEESIKLDSKLVEVLESQLKLKQEEKQVVSSNSNNEIDHSLALKVADEIIRIQKNLQQMDSETRGLKQLSASVKRIQDNFASNGYELVEMLGKEYNEGMKVIANFIPSEDLETGKQIITRIIKPQVNFKGQMIQSAQIEVSVGE